MSIQKKKRSDARKVEAVTKQGSAIGKRLEEIRGNRTQEQVADNVATAQQTWSKYERGLVPKSWKFLAVLAENEGVDLNRFLQGLATANRKARS